MAKLAQTQEPSMEEILASIRRIITEDEVGGQQAPGGQPAASPKVSPQSRKAESVPEDDDLPADDDGDGNVALQSAGVLELSEEQMTAVQPGVDLTESDADTGFAEEEARSANEAHSTVATIKDGNALVGTSLLSAGTDAAVTSAFSALANTILSTESRTLEDLVRDMLRPMLKSWLDANLPPLVERLVREEIERVSRGRR